MTCASTNSAFAADAIPATEAGMVRMGRDIAVLGDLAITEGVMDASLANHTLDLAGDLLATNGNYYLGGNASLPKRYHPRDEVLTAPCQNKAVSNSLDKLA